MLVYLKTTQKRITITQPTEYIRTVHFDREIFPETLPEGLGHFFQKYSRKTYIPIVSFPNGTTRTQMDCRNEILSAAENLIVQRLNIPTNIRNGLTYLIGEAVDNISEHSQSQRGYIFMQYYPNKSYLDVCIADNGITILGSYRKIPEKGIVTDAEAIRWASAGISTKNVPGAENRGYGIGTSKKMLVNGLGGEYFILSGGAFHIKNQSRDHYVTLPPTLRWQGTIIALRIPFHKKDDFNYINYIE